LGLSGGYRYLDGRCRSILLGPGQTEEIRNKDLVNMKDIIFSFKKIYWFVVRPKTFGVKCIIQDNQGKILMLRKNFAYKGWVFPGGAIRQGEKPVDAIRREIKEDLGITLENVHELGSFFQRVHYRKETMYCFSAITSSLVTDFNKEKIEEVGWFERTQLPPLSPISQSVMALFK